MAAPENISVPHELKRRILFTLAMLAIYRMGVAVPTPGVDSEAVMEFFRVQGGLFGVFNTFTGGALEQFSVFALGIMPYISASIIFQLLQSAVPSLQALKKEGEQGRKKINQYTRYATVLLAMIQGYAMARLLSSSTTTDGRSLISHPVFGFVPFEVLAVVTLTAGTCFLMWLGEQITEKGVGNGASLIIFAGIAASIPGGAAALFQTIADGQINGVLGLIVITGVLLSVAGIVFMEVGQRRIPIQYSQRGTGKQAMQKQASYLPLKVNMANVIPPIFASSLLGSPAAIVSFVDAPWAQQLAQQFTPTGALFNVIFTGLIIFFCFFYTEIVFNPTEVADNLKKYSGFIPGIRAGKSTAAYVKKVLDRLTMTGAIYLSFICIAPTLIISQFNLPFNFNGTSLLILVGVALDTSQQIQSHMLTAKYEGLMKGVKMKSRRVSY